MDKNVFVTFIIPVLNSAKYIGGCLKSIRKQDYSPDSYEIIVVDGGSDDETVDIAKSYKAKVLTNPSVDQESGKSLGIQKSRGEIIVLMDSDNEIIKKDWLRKMMAPLLIDPTLFGVESLYFSKKKDNIFNRYCMLLHIADPFSRAIAARLNIQKKAGYLECTIPSRSTYPLGANGFLWNKKVIEKVGLFKPKFEESNFTYYILEKGFRKFARVPGYGIYHYHINSFSDFVRKRLKIGNKFLSRREEKKRTWLEGVSPIKFVFAAVYCSTFIGPSFEALINYFKTKEIAWFLHPLMCFVSVATYALVWFRRKLDI